MTCDLHKCSQIEDKAQREFINQWQQALSIFCSSCTVQNHTNFVCASSSTVMERLLMHDHNAHNWPTKRWAICLLEWIANFHWFSWLSVSKLIYFRVCSLAFYRASNASAVLGVVILSVRHTRALWLIQRTYRWYFYITRKGNHSTLCPRKNGPPKHV